MKHIAQQILAQMLDSSRKLWNRWMMWSLDIIEAERNFLNDFDEELFSERIDKVIVEGNQQLLVRLKNGLELSKAIERTAQWQTKETFLSDAVWSWKDRSTFPRSRSCGMDIPKIYERYLDIDEPGELVLQSSNDMWFSAEICCVEK